MGTTEQSPSTEDGHQVNFVDSDKLVRRVLHVVNGEYYSGAERVQDLLASALPEFGYEVGFACVKPDLFPQQRTSQDVPLYQTKMKSKFDLASAKSLAEIARIGGYDFLHAHTARSLLVARLAARIANKPLVYHVHSPTSKDSTSRFTNRINAWLERVCLTGVSRIICVSRSLAEHMESHGYNPDLLRVVPNGVPAKSELFVRDKPKDTWTVGSVALFRPRKGMEVLIESLAIVRSYGHDVRIRAVGPFETPEYEGRIKALAAKRGVAEFVEWVGFSEDVDSELAKMDLMVLPSLFGEGLPMVIIEAMAAGVPVIGTNVQGVPEVITEGNGLIAEPGCAASLSNCIQRFVKSEVEWSATRAAAWQRQASHFSARSMAQGVAQVYDEMLGIVRESVSVPDHEVANSVAVSD